MRRSQRSGSQPTTDLAMPVAVGTNAALKTRQWIAVVIALVFGAMISHFFIYITHG